MTRLQLEDKLRDLAEVRPGNFETPFITIAREPGSGGAPIAKAVAERLGFTLLDEQIVKEIAKSTKSRREIIRQVDEKSRTVIGEMVHSMFNEEYVSDLKYLKELAKVILVYAHQGNVVILGRGANFMTPFAKGLHVNIQAPYDIRVNRAVEFEGHTKAKAKKVIAAVEKERHQFVKQFLSKDLTKAEHYDLSVNTAHYSIEQARDLIIEAFVLKFGARERYGALVRDTVERFLPNK